MNSLTKLAAQIESKKANDDWAAHKDAFAAQEAEQETAAYVAEMAEEAAMGIGPTPEEWGALASPEKIREALMDGGRAEVTVRSHSTGKHVTVVLVVRKKKAGGQGWVPRTHAEGRVGFAEGDCIEARDPELEYPDNYVGRFYKDTGEWKAGKTADGARVYAAEKVIAMALAGAQLASEVFLASRCRVCGTKLTDPESITDGIGPECKGKATKSKMAPHS